jgi:cell division protein FtsL
LTLVTSLILVGFTTLMVRLAVVTEGYRLSALSAELAELQQSNRALRLEVAELSSHQRLRVLASKFGMGPPARGQVVVVP